ncbi:MAG: hypothetical protein R3F16_23075 [Myxococcota bacterium]|nr:hypothetical protein [Myxococcales bacterium]
MLLLYTVVAGALSIVSAWLMTYRLFALARRTGQTPEWLLATAFGGFFCVGYPLMGMSRLPAMAETSEGSLLYALGATGMVVGIAALSRFPKVVFRPKARWATALCAATTIAGAVSALGLTIQAISAPTFEEMIARGLPWAIALVLSLGVPFLWNAIESLVYYRRMRRRRVLGLASPSATHAFLLWSIASWVSVLQVVLLVAVRLAGQPILSPGPMALIATCALVTWACWSLAFFMPDVYRRHVLGEHPTDATEQG